MVRKTIVFAALVCAALINPASAENETVLEPGIGMSAPHEVAEIRVWTPLKIYRVLKAMGYWPAVKAALLEADLYEAFIMAQELREDDADFQQGYSWAVETYGKEAVEAILSAASEMQD